MSSINTNLEKSIKASANDFFTTCGFYWNQFRKTMNHTRYSRLMVAAFSLLLFNFSGLAFGNTPPEKLGFVVTFSKSELRVGDTVEMIFKAKTPFGFHVYSEKSDCPKDDGPNRSEFAFTENPGIQLLGSAYGVGDTMVLDTEIWNCSTGEFKDAIEFRQKIHILSVTPTIHVKYFGQKCSIYDGICFLIEEDLTIPLNIH